MKSWINNNLESTWHNAFENQIILEFRKRDIKYFESAAMC